MGASRPSAIDGNPYELGGGSLTARSFLLGFAPASDITNTLEKAMLSASRTRNALLIASVVVAINVITAAPVRPALGDSNGCTGTATLDTSHEPYVWYMDCGGSSCGANNNLPCTPLTGGRPGGQLHVLRL